jgi:hypothetical protein
MWLDMPTKHTYCPIGVNSISLQTTGQEKTRVTVVLCVSRSGDKMPPVIIASPTEFPNKDKERLDTFIQQRKSIPGNKLYPLIWQQSKSHMNSELMVQWLDLFKNCTTGQGIETPTPILLMDSFSGHISKSVKEACHEKEITMVVIPGGCTSHVQPLDISVNRSFKANLRPLWTDWMYNERILPGIQRQESSGHVATPAGNTRRIDMPTLLDMVHDAWTDITPDVIRNGFIKAKLEQITTR